MSVTMQTTRLTPDDALNKASPACGGLDPVSQATQENFMAAALFRVIVAITPMGSLNSPLPSPQPRFFPQLA